MDLNAFKSTLWGAANTLRGSAVDRTDWEVKNALRKTLLKYRLHQDQDLFERAYDYIRSYY